MKVYLAGEDFRGVESSIKRRLFSYWYHKKNTKHIDKAVEYGQDLFLDSGAFSAFMKGIDISPDDYAEFLHKNGDKFTCRSSLDVIGNAQGSYDKLKELESMGCQVQPVFHAREDESWLKKYIAEGYDYIFIGGMVPESTSWLTTWLDDLFDRILCNSDGTAKVKLHGFGLTDTQLMFRYPWHSVDSSSWCAYTRYTWCVFNFNGNFKKVKFSPDCAAAKNLNAPHFTNLSPFEQKEITRWLDKYGITPEECAFDYRKRAIVNTKTYEEAEEQGTLTFKKQQMTLF